MNQGVQWKRAAPITTAGRPRHRNARLLSHLQASGEKCHEGKKDRQKEAHGDSERQERTSHWMPSLAYVTLSGNIEPRIGGR